MDHAKYIIYDAGIGDSVVIFPAFINHADMARDLSITAISAGFIEFHDNEVWAYGKSVSLGVRARQGDADRIKRYLGIE